MRSVLMRVSGTVLVLALVLGMVLVGPVAADENWPQFRGPNGDGLSDATDLPVTWSETEHVRWKTPIHDRGWASPVVWGDQIWLTTASKEGHQMYVLCIDRTSGKILHDIKLLEVPKPEFCHPLNSYASPTPVIEEGRVYVHFGSYGTACLDTRTARVLWMRRDLPCNHWRGPGSSPILYKGMLIVHFDGYDYQYVVALDKETGQTIWKTDRNVDYGTDDGDIMKAFSTPIVIQVAGKPQLISPTSKAALAYDPATGREIWRVRYKSFSATAMPMYGGGLLYIDTGFGKADLVAVRPDGRGDVTDTHITWVVKKSVPSKPSPLLVGDRIYMVHDGGVASCLDAKTGEEIWTKRLGGQHSASPIHAEGRIYFFSQEGVATVVRAADIYEELASNKLDAGFMASPAVAGKALYLRTETHLYRIEK